MAGWGGLGGSLAEALFAPSPERPFPDRPAPPPAATPGLMDQIREWLRGNAAPAEAAPLAPDVFPTERPPPEDIRPRSFPDRPEAALTPTTPPKPEDPLGLGAFLALPGQAIQAREAVRQAGQGYQQAQSEERQVLAGWNPLSGEPVPESLLTGGPVSPGSMAGIARFATGPKGLAARTEAGLDLPDVSRLRKLYKQGVKLGGNKWYHDFADTIKRIHGEEADTFAGVVAALSPLREAGALKPLAAKRLGPEAASHLADIMPQDIHMGSNLLYAERVWDAYKRGGIPEVERTLGALMTKGGQPTELAQALAARGESALGVGVMDSVRNNVLNALHGRKLGASGADTAEKINNFRRALMGDTSAIVLDTWMKKVFYPFDRKHPANRPPPMKQAWEGKPVPVEEGVVDVSGMRPGEMVPREYTAFTPGQYAHVSDIITTFARKMKTTPADVQAALWVAQKYLEQGEQALAGSMPFVDSLKIVRNFMGKDLAAFGPQAEKALAVTAMVLGGSLLGGEAGGAAEAEAAEPEPAMPAMTTGGRQRLVP